MISPASARHPRVHDTREYTTPASTRHVLLETRAWRSGSKERHVVMWGEEHGKVRSHRPCRVAAPWGVPGPSLSIRPSGGRGGQAERHVDCTLTRLGPFSLAHTAHTGPWVWWGKGQGWAPSPCRRRPLPPEGQRGARVCCLLSSPLRLSTLSRGKHGNSDTGSASWGGSKSVKA